MARSEEQILGDIEALCAQAGYAHAIASICFRDNLVRYQAELRAEEYAKLFTWSRLIRTEISTLLGYLAKSPMDLKRPSKIELNEMIDNTDCLMSELHERMQDDFIPLFRASLNEGLDSNPFTKPGGLREPIFYGGESAYSFQYRDFAPFKYAKDSKWLKSNYGFDIKEAHQIVMSIHEVLTFKANVIYHSTEAESDKPLLSAFTFTASEIHLNSGIPDTTINAFLRAFSLLTGSNTSFKKLDDFNKISACPIFDLCQTYICFQYVSLTEAIYETPFFWMIKDVCYREKAALNRGKFVEGFCFDKLIKIFGKDSVFQNVNVMDGVKTLAEIDCLVIFGSRIIVVQAKSKRMTIEARKGNDLQLKKDFKAAIQDACDQALKCIRLVSGGAVNLITADGVSVPIPPNLKQCFPMCVISDHYPALSFQCSQFLKFETTDLMAHPFVLDIFALDAICEMLDSPLRLISYLHLRSIAGFKISTPHELTTLAYHLRNNLWLQEFDFMHIHDDISAPLDIAMAVRRDKVPGERTPKGILTALQGTKTGFIIDAIEKRVEDGLVEFGLMLLRLSPKSALRFGHACEKIAHEARFGNSKDFTLWNKEDKSGITIHCNSHHAKNAIEKLELHCALRKYSQEARIWFGISIEPVSSKVRFGLTLEFPWMKDPDLDAATVAMPQPKPLRGFDKFIEKRIKIGRNQLCPCGSNKKFKRCCGSSL